MRIDEYVTQVIPSNIYMSWRNMHYSQCLLTNERISYMRHATCVHLSLRVPYMPLHVFKMTATRHIAMRESYTKLLCAIWHMKETLGMYTINHTCGSHLATPETWNLPWRYTYAWQCALGQDSYKYAHINESRPAYAPHICIDFSSYPSVFRKANEV